jgi:hypothetical protein
MTAHRLRGGDKIPARWLHLALTLLERRNEEEAHEVLFFISLLTCPHTDSTQLHTNK